jgi:hypothetical protein
MRSIAIQSMITTPPSAQLNKLQLHTTLALLQQAQLLQATHTDTS